MKWISVKNRLPDFGIPVLVSNNNIVQNVLYFREKTNKGFLWMTAIEVMGDDFAFMDEFSHWTLPNPPKDK